MSDPCNDLLQIHVNGQQTFFLSEKILTNYSEKLRKMIKQQKRRTQVRKSGIEIDDFPGGPHGFELVSRFCYNDGVMSITVSNVSLLHCCAAFLEMTEIASSVNLLHQTEVFLEGIFYWSWNEILTCLKNCEPFFDCADSCGLIEKLMCSLLAKIAQNSDVSLFSLSSSSSSSSPEMAHSLRSQGVCENASLKRTRAWWFQDLTILGPKIIEQFLKALGCYGTENNNLIITRFLIHYLKTTLLSNYSKSLVSADYTGLADTAAYGVVLTGKTAFSCRGLFSVLRIVSRFGLSRKHRAGLERLIGSMLDQAMLDDLLVSSGGDGGRGVYDVNFVLRLIGLFVHYNNDKVSSRKMKKVGELIDVYLGEIGPDQNLKISKFLGVAESLPDCARDSYDYVYRAIDIYLESHPTLSLEERSRLCRCLNYKKLSLEACKDLAKNPRIPPRAAVEALASQHPTIQTAQEFVCDDDSSPRSIKDYQIVLYKNEHGGVKSVSDTESFPEGEEMKVNLERMQWKVVELEKVCREMKGQMARMAKLGGPQYNRPLPRLC
ncbi:BTB/POZ domain-containing protein at3g19850 [Phtheirospermum japonicum]|uniref:BTB/POZ domain-containing protein at3g19850 n=1 Tax=Phtheirospermum japonicum TaxID=374723 RepID=A0A830C0P1_9LAMI|nr:BTB/POZ domain-containing protein at3g19850 [Phtheirospermum japonicum]